MVKVSIEDVVEDMVVAQDVHGQNGLLLVRRGRMLSEEHIRAMRAFGVHAVDIVREEEACTIDNSHAIVQMAEATWRELLRPRFEAWDLTASVGETLWRLTASQAANRALEIGFSPDVSCNRPALVCLPPEQHLFAQHPFDPALLVSGTIELATLPEVYTRLVEVMHSPNSSPRAIADVVRHDPSLTAKLLRLVNSPVYGASMPVDTISRAVSVVGQKELTTLVLGLAACNAFTDIAPELWDMRAFWRHAAACGVYGAVLAASCPGAVADRVFVGGLLHDIGQLVILRKLPAAAGRALLLSRIEGLPLAEAEQAVLGFDHTAVGRALLARWHFPDSLVAMVADHHHPSGLPDDRETALIHVADILATALVWPALDGPPIPPLSEAAWRSLDVPVSILAEVAETGKSRIRDIEADFFDPSAV